MFIKAYNQVILNKDRLIQDTNEVIALLTNTSQLEEEIEKLNIEIRVVAELINKLVKENSKTNISLEEYNKKYEELSSKYNKTNEKLQELIELKTYKKAQALKMEAFLRNLINSKDNINSWDDSIWRIMVESAVVHRDASRTFKFYNG